LSSAPELPDIDEKILKVGRKILDTFSANCGEARSRLVRLGDSARPPVQVRPLSTTREVGVGRVRSRKLYSMSCDLIFDAWESASKSGLAEKLSHLKFRHA
jgi:hypothetical protein